MNAVRLGDEITLAGPPRNLTAVVLLDVARSMVVPIVVKSAEHSASYRAVLRTLGAGKSELRLRAPDDTAPGTYAGEATIGGKPRAVIIEVEPTVRVRLQPSHITVTAAAASSTEFTFTAINGGNVRVVIPTADVFDLDDAVGQDRALGRTLRAPLALNERRVDRFFEELRESHGGEAQVTVRRGAGPLLPGEVRDITCLLKLPETVKAQRSYLGVWQLGSAVLVVAADVVASTRPTKTRAAT